MKLHQISKILVVVVSIHNTAFSQPKQKSDLLIGSTLIAKSANDEIKVTYELPCGTEFEGFLFHPIERAVEIGAVLKVRRFSCTGLSQYKVATIAGLRHSSFETLYSIRAMNLRGKPSIRPVTQVQLSPETGLTYKLQSQYRSKCGLPLGYIVSPGKRFEVSFLEQERTTKTEDCQQSPQLADWGGLKFRGLKSLQIKAKHKQPFSTHLTRVRLSNKASQQEKGQLEFRYLRRCNEAPIGPVFHQGKGKAKDQLEIAMVVARYTDKLCGQKSGKTYWTRYRSQHIKIGAKAKLIPMRLARKARIDLSPPHRLPSKLQVALDAPIKIHALTGCQPTKGIAVVEKNHSLFISTVISSDIPESRTRCGHPLKAVVYTMNDLTFKGQNSLKPLFFKKIAAQR